MVNVGLSASGTLVGSVLDADLNPAGSNLAVNLRGPTSGTDLSDGFSEYRFDYIPLGNYTIESEDADGNRGRTNASLTGTNQVVGADLVFLGRGAVNVLVEGATGTPVVGAEVRLTSRSLFGGSFTGATGTFGDAFFADVFVGDFQVYAQDAATGLAGLASGSVAGNGDLVDVTVTLAPAAELAGTVFESDGTTPVEAAVVRLSPSGREVTTDASGTYRFDALPLATYTINVEKPSNGDRQRAVAALEAPDTTVTQDLILNGLGTVNVTVLDAGGELVPDAIVELSTQGGFSTRHSGVTGAEGVVSLPNVLAGPFEVSAMDPVDVLGGDVSSSLLPGEVVDVTVTLEPSADLRGTVFAADGITPVAGATVRLTPLGRTAVSGTDGGFIFPMIPVNRSPYSLEARDANGTLRASVGGVMLTSHGEQVTQDLVFSGLGVVTGTVLNPDGGVAEGASVTVTSTVSGMPNRYATTDGFGLYEIADIPEGSFTVIARNSALYYSGSATGAVSANGETVTVDVAMTDNAIAPVPVPPGGDPAAATLARLYDANGFEFAVQQTGEVRDGTSAGGRSGGVFRGIGAETRGGMRLTLIADEEEHSFAGAGGSYEESGRELSIRGGALVGLSVSRKVYVPADG